LLTPRVATLDQKGYAIHLARPQSGIGYR